MQSPFTAIDLDKEEDGKALRALITSQFGRTKLPAIWITRKLIGGYSELNALNNKNELDAMLKYVPRTKHTSPR